MSIFHGRPCLSPYVFNNPNSLIDPLGLCAVKDTLNPFELMWNVE